MFQAKDFTILTGNTNIWAPINYATSAMTFAGGQTNQLQGLAVNNGIKLRVELVPLLSSFTNGFYVFRNDSAVKSLILQNEVDIDVQATDASNDEYKKFRRFIFSLYTSRAAGYGRWQSAIRATFS